MSGYVTEAQHVALTLLGWQRDWNGAYEHVAGDHRVWLTVGIDGGWFHTDDGTEYDDPIACALDWKEHHEQTG